MEVVVRSKVPILPNTSVRLRSGDSQRRPAFYPERVRVEDATDWIVNDVLLCGRSLCVQAGDLPAELLSCAGHPALSFGRLDPGDEFTLMATYVGPREAGAELVYRIEGRAKPSSAPRSCPLPMSSGVGVLPNVSAQLTSRVQTLPEGHGFQVRRVVIRDPQDWVVNDVRIGRASQFAQAGDVPGVAFQATGADQVVAFDPVAPGIDVQMVVTYVGADPAGAPFVGGMVGDVVPTPLEDRELRALRALVEGRDPALQELRALVGSIGDQAGRLPGLVDAVRRVTG